MRKPKGDILKILGVIINNKITKLSRDRLEEIKSTLT